MMTGDRQAFVGAHLLPGVKEALRIEALAQGKSMSQFVCDAIEEKLKALGVEFPVQPVDNGPELPFEQETLADA